MARPPASTVATVGNRGEEAHEVRRTAGAGIPGASSRARRPAGFGVGTAADVERVGVEEPAPVQRQAGEQPVQAGALDEIGEARLPGGEQQPPGEHHAGDRRTGFRVGGVGRQLVCIAEGLVPLACAEAAGEVGARCDHRFPTPDDRREQLPVIRLNGEIDRSAVEVQLPHGVTGRLAGGAHRHVVLPVARAEPIGPQQPTAATIDQGGGELQMTRRARDPVQLHERHLDSWMSVDELARSGSQLGADALHCSLRDPQQPVVIERPLPGDRRLDEMAARVELVPPLEVRERPRVGQLHVAVEVAVVPLRCRHDLDDPIRRRGEAGVALHADLPADRLQPLVHVGVEEGEGEAGIVGSCHVRPSARRCRTQVFEISGRLQLTAAVQDRDGPIRSTPLRPKAAVDRHGTETERSKTHVGR